MTGGNWSKMCNGRNQIYNDLNEVCGYWNERHGDSSA